MDLLFWLLHCPQYSCFLKPTWDDSYWYSWFLQTFWFHDLMRPQLLIDPELPITSSRWQPSVISQSKSISTNLDFHEHQWSVFEKSGYSQHSSVWQPCWTRGQHSTLCPELQNQGTANTATLNQSISYFHLMADPWLTQLTFWNISNWGDSVITLADMAHFSTHSQPLINTLKQI